MRSSSALLVSCCSGIGHWSWIPRASATGPCQAQKTEHPETDKGRFRVLAPEIWARETPRPWSAGALTRERERDSLTYKSLECPRDTFSLISYRYVKIPEPDPDVFTPADPPAHYPFFYPFSFLPFRFSHKLLIVIKIQKNSEKISFFWDLLALFIRTELPPAMIPPAWSAGVFFIYGPFLPSPLPGEQPRIRAPPPGASSSGQTPEASLRRCPAVMRDAHV